MVQIPDPMKLTTPLLMLHTAALPALVVNVTASPDVALAVGV